MGERVTWRSHPRSDYPWPYPTIKTTVANLLVGFPFDYEYLIGPLDVAGVVELIYRVNQISWSLSVTTEFDGDTTVLTGSGVMEQRNLSGILPTEKEVFEYNRAIEFQDEIQTIPDFYRAFNFFSTDTEIISSIELLDYVEPFPRRTHPIYEDENGNFWLHGAFNCLIADDENFNKIAGATNFLSQAALYTLEIHATLVLHSGTYLLKAVAGGGDSTPSSATYTLTATRWHAYATTTGADAWNTTTGSPANGGPGA
jgi:hypothetical protein